MRTNKNLAVFNAMSCPQAANQFRHLDMMPKSKFWEVKNLEDDNKPAELLIYGVIGDDGWFSDIGSKQFAEDMLALRGRDIKVRINSPGGGVYAGLAIYSALVQHDGKVTTYVDALAASAASVVAMAGDEVVMPVFSQMMIHNPWSMAGGEAKDFREAADYLDKVRDSIVPVYEKKTGLSKDQIMKMLDEETWLSAEEAREYGFADRVEASMKVAASIRDGNMTLNGVTFSMDRFKTLPAALLSAAEQKASKPQKPETAGTQMSSKTEDVMDLEKIKNQHPDLYKQIMDLGREEGVQAGVNQERARIKAIEDMAMPGHNELVNKAKFESGQTAEQLAVSMIQAEKQRGAKFLNDRQSDSADLSGLDQQEPDLNQQTADDQKRSKWRAAASKVAGNRGNQSK